MQAETHQNGNGAAVKSNAITMNLDKFVHHPPVTPEEIAITKKIQAAFGVNYWPQGEVATYEAPEHNLYYYKAFIGLHTDIAVERGDSIFYLGQDAKTVHLRRGPFTVDESPHMAVLMRGYMPENKDCSVSTRTILPYVNGCSTKQLFAPDRLGDPTLQMLTIPPYSAEQAHHIHSTVRAVYVVSGKGISVVGMDDCTVTEELVPGKVCILEPMCPHHFETPQGEALTVIPFHVFSSVGAMESNHPMFNGTHLMSQS